jgi:hypothetical protein
MTELCWYKNYSNPLTIDINQNKINDYVNKLLNKHDEKNLENKISQIEKDYNDKLKNLENLCKNTNDIDKLTTKGSLIILQKELEIIKLLTKYTLQNKNLDYKFFTACLKILLKLSETLRLRLGQKELIHEKINKNDSSLYRCSYKFCSYQDNCSYNYNAKTKNLCYQDHYVHNMVSADLKILIDYINQKYEHNNLILHNKEILKTINTLSYVISHMELELRTKCLYSPENEWENFHVIKNK